VGQLIPLIIGAAGLIRTIHLIIIEKAIIVSLGTERKLFLQSFGLTIH
jgi:hypothetical protein